MVFSFLVLGSSFQVPVVQGALDYQLLENIPGTSGLSGSDLPGYVSAIYKVALIIVTLSAVLMLSVGGFMYLTSAGNTASIGTAKGIIYDSLIGLVIALSAWLVLYIINPDLVKISLNSLPPLNIESPPAPTPTGTSTLPPQSTIDLATQILSNPNITLASGGDCSSPSGVVSPLKNMQDVAAGKLMATCKNGCAAMGSNGCTDNSKRPSEAMLQAMWTVGQTHTFTVESIGGGSHANNSLHYSGQAIDAKPVSQALLDTFVKAGAITPSAPPLNTACQMAGFIACGYGNGASMCEKDGKNVGCNPPANHMHIIF